jgi:hypothetical protein
VVYLGYAQNIMDIPSYWLRCPEYDAVALNTKLETAFQNATQDGSIAELPVPTWVFLHWLTKHKHLLAHGTGNQNIVQFVPRQSDDVGWFGNQNAVYAASDGIWAMFFAVMNRPDVPMSISNAAIRLKNPPQDVYFFSVTDTAMQQHPFRDGWVYLLPRDGFVLEPSPDFYISQHWASLEPVTPLFKVRVKPQDFPFLQQIRSHSDAVLWQRAEKNPNGFPWLED